MVWQPKATVGRKTNPPPTEGAGSRPPQPKRIVVEVMRHENKKDGDL